MRPGKLFYSISGITACPVDKPEIAKARRMGTKTILPWYFEDNLWTIKPKEIFIVLAVGDACPKTYVEFYRIKFPWLVLAGEKVALIETLNEQFTDVTPF